MIYKDQAELDAGLAKWQKILRLQDWDVIVSFERSHNISGTGECSVHFATKSATIRLLNEAEGRGTQCVQWGDVLDMEQILVHELLHIHFASFRPYQGEKVCVEHDLWEQVIETLSKTMVSLERGQK